MRTSRLKFAAAEKSSTVRDLRREDILSYFTMARRSGALLLATFMVGLLLLSGLSFVQPQRAAQPAAEAGVDNTAAIAAMGLAAPLVVGQPAFAADSPPGWPFLLAFTTVISVIFIIPNIVFPGPKR
eukprot:TRINITY_DN3564_c0_g3_i1.p1 TRINITY_DN3564_c0_g3~~TRINITY_DN3564_c0_g3_i1.p1  ORF type:complete len:127 (+),score=34.12 TRINITY_DN3564_c0_g3_i1:29-409(+)